jgi:hypothetical protein
MKSRQLRRRAARRAPLARILIVCEGRVTEAFYFDALRKELRATLIEIEVDDKGGVPLTLVNRAVAKRQESQREAGREEDENLLYDQVWCVFDIDEHPNLEVARRKAAANDIMIADSNPCFELWGVLHYQARTASAQRGEVRKLLKRHLPRYKKELPYEQLSTRYSEAVTRAKELNRRCQIGLCPSGNPSTKAYQLCEVLRAKFGKRTY